MFNQTITVITILAALLIVYHHAIYPVFLNWLGKKKRNQRSTALLEAEENSLNTDGLPSITIVIPAYNEEKTIHLILDKVKDVQLMDDIKKEVVIVNDCSKDGTEEAIHKYMEANPELQISYFKHEKNQGKGAALLFNFLQLAFNGFGQLQSISQAGQVVGQCPPAPALGTYDALVDAELHPACQQRANHVKYQQGQDGVPQRQGALGFRE